MPECVGVGGNKGIQGTWDHTVFILHLDGSDGRQELRITGLMHGSESLCNCVFRMEHILFLFYHQVIILSYESKLLFS